MKYKIEGKFSFNVDDHFRVSAEKSIGTFLEELRCQIVSSFEDYTTYNYQTPFSKIKVKLKRVK